MTATPLKVAVVGHTNTGKTSLLRTLTRDEDFGEVSARPAVTRHVEGAALLVDGQTVLELYDTPGLEDSIGLLDWLDQQQSDRRADGLEQVRHFLEAPDAAARFAQEAKALRQVLDSGVALYVVDARDRVLAKHRDELEILRRCAVPVVPVLNFVADPDARTGEWRDHLSRAGLHAVAEFDTVVFDEDGERRLFEKMRTLLDSHRDALQELIDDRMRRRAALVVASAELVADLVLDAAATVQSVPADRTGQADEALASMRDALRQREQRCVEHLLELHRFRTEDCQPGDLPVTEGRWGLDLFSAEALKQFGFHAGGGAAAGALAGLAVDAMTAGMTFGIGAATGAAIGALIGTAQSHGQKLIDRARGRTELRFEDRTLRLLAARQIELVRALLRRGHAALTRIEVAAPARHRGQTLWSDGLPPEVLLARSKPTWSRLAGPDGGRPTHDPARADALRRLAERVRRETLAGAPGLAS